MHALAHELDGLSHLQLQRCSEGAGLEGLIPVYSWSCRDGRERYMV